MKTFEGTYTIRWGKNTALDIRPITFDCMSKEELQKELQRIIVAFSKGDDKESPFYRKWHDDFISPYSIKFNMNERK
jgi:hypothetical protein